MRRTFNFPRPTTFESLGRNGYMATVGCDLLLMDTRIGPATVLMTPINSRQVVGRAQVAVDAEAAGDVGAFFIEAFCKTATPEARRDLLDRLALICDPAFDPDVDPEAGEDEEPNAPAPGM